MSGSSSEVAGGVRCAVSCVAGVAVVVPAPVSGQRCPRRYLCIAVDQAQPGMAAGVCLYLAQSSPARPAVTIPTPLSVHAVRSRAEEIWLLVTNRSSLLNSFASTVLHLLQSDINLAES